MIEVRRIAFAHSPGSAPVLHDISLDIPGGGITAVLGPNGSGKTTLLKCIAGLWKIRQGEILISEKHLWDYTAAERARIVSYVPQNHQPVFPYRVSDVVLMGRTPHLNRFGHPGKKDRIIAQDALETLEIARLSDRIYSKLSGGERQLVLIARSLAQQASVMLLDEPVSHLDFKNQIRVMRQILRISEKKGLTVLMTLHDPNLAAAFSDHLILMKRGSLLCQGNADSMITPEILSDLYDMAIRVGNGNRKWVYPSEE